MNSDLLLTNGRIFTGNPRQEWATAVVARGGKLVYVGDGDGARARAGQGAERVDLGGRLAVPGLCDAHMHAQWYALGLESVQAETSTLAEALERVRARAATAPAGSWITGFGWNHNAWGGEFPTRADLDRVAPQHPVALNAKSGHALWANSRALALAGITAGTPDPANGQIVRDGNGEPTGVLLEEAAELVESGIPESTLAELIEALRRAMAEANRLGLTAVHDFDGPLAFAAHQELDAEGALTWRITKSIPLAHLDEAVGLGLRSGFGNEWLRVGHVKMFADGALGPRTALMLEGYDSAPEELGIAVTPPQRMAEAVRRANSSGLACAIHAIGDRAVREVLDIYQEQQQPLRAGAARNRIEHVQLINPRDAGRLAELGVAASMQPLHATSDMEMADKHWGARSAGAYALRTQLEAGTVLAFGSDCPVEVIDPRRGIHAAVTRRRADGSPGPQGWYPEQRLSVAEAIRGFTWGPAVVAGREREMGSLEPGKLADVTIFEHDLFRIDPMDILEAEVAGTIVGGKFVWRHAGLA